MGILEPKKIVLLNYPLGLSLLKYRNVWVFWNKKKSGSNRCSPLNSSIDYIIYSIHHCFCCKVGANVIQFIIAFWYNPGPN